MTLQEVETSFMANWEFWSQAAREALCCYMSSRRICGPNHQHTRRERARFREIMRNRRAMLMLSQG